MESDTASDKAAEWVERSGALMAWAVAASDRRATYIGSLRRDQTGLACECVCPACGGQLQAVNAGKSLQELPAGKSLRPHFRHHTGQQQDACLVKMSQIVALQLLLQESVICLPEQSTQRKVAGASGRTYTGVASRPGATLSILSREWVDEHEAKITLPGGRVVWVRLFGSIGRGLDAVGEAIINIKVDDPEVSTWPPEKILEHAQLTGEFMCWERHWADAELAQQAQFDAEQQAQHWCDLIPPDMEFADDLSSAQRSEGLLHWVIKKILEEASSITTPSHQQALKRVMPDDYDVTEWVQWPQKVYRISNARLEFRLKGMVPDVLCTAVCSNEPPLELMIEVVVTHPVDLAKATRIRAMGLACLEVDARKFGKDGRVTVDELRAMVLSQVECKHWIVHPGIDAMKLAAERALEEKYQRALREIRETRARAERLQSMTDAELLQEYLSQLRQGWQTNGPFWSLGTPNSPGTILGELSERRFREMDEPVLVHSDRLLWMIDAIANKTQRVSPVSLLEQAMRRGEFASMQEYASVVGMAITVYAPNLSPAVQRNFDALREKMRASIQAHELTYARPTRYDRALALLFPALKERLESGKGTQNVVENARSARRMAEYRTQLEEDAKRQRQKEERALHEALEAHFSEIEPYYVWLPRTKLTEDVAATLQHVEKFMSERDILYHPDWKMFVETAWQARDCNSTVVQWLRTQLLEGAWGVDYRLRILERASLLYNRGP